MLRLISFLVTVVSVSTFSGLPHRQRDPTNHLTEYKALVTEPDGCQSGLGMTTLGDSNYVKVLNSKSATLVDACAKWCGPCKLIEPTLNRCAKKWEGVVAFVKFDVEIKNPDLKLEFLMQDVMPQSLPSLILFKDGKALAKHNGVITEDQLNEFIKTNLSGAADRSPSSSDELRNAKESAPEKKAGFVSFSEERDDYMLGDPS